MFSYLKKLKKGDVDPHEIFSLTAFRIMGFVPICLLISDNIYLNLSSSVATISSTTKTPSN